MYNHTFTFVTNNGSFRVRNNLKCELVNNLFYSHTFLYK